MSRKDSFYQERARLVIESMMFGLAYGAGLCWASVCLLASFRPDILAMPYWSGIRYLRSDTCGVLAFFLVAIFLTCSEFLRLRRRASGLVRPPHALLTDRRSAAVFAVAETVAILATGTVIYLSLNSITHPVTLEIQATHLISWPSEGTLRVISLFLCGCSVGALRFLRAKRSSGLQNYPETPAIPSISGLGARAVQDSGDYPTSDYKSRQLHHRRWLSMLVIPASWVGDRQY